MPDSIRTLLDRLALLLFQRQFPGMLEHMDLPMAVQIEGEMTVISSPSHFNELLTTYRDALDDLGLTGLSVRLSAVELPRKGRFRLWAELDHVQDDSLTKGADKFILYCRQDGAAFRVELIHCVKLAFLEVDAVPQARLA